MPNITYFHQIRGLRYLAGQIAIPKIGLQTMDKNGNRAVIQCPQRKGLSLLEIYYDMTKLIEDERGDVKRKLLLVTCKSTPFQSGPKLFSWPSYVIQVSARVRRIQACILFNENIMSSTKRNKEPNQIERCNTWSYQRSENCLVYLWKLNG